jgi:Ser/Thr protein kinase RdoA (MazF antagonist)
MFALIERIGAKGLTRDEIRDHKRAQGQRDNRSRQFTYRFRPESKDYALVLKFSEPSVERVELINTLREILDRLVNEESQTSPSH